MAKQSDRWKHWRELVREHAGSGLTRAAFAAHAGVSLKSLQRWRSRLLHELDLESPPAVVEVVLKPTPTREPPAPPIELLVGKDCVLYIAPGTPTDDVAIALGLILDVYRVEHEARSDGIVGSDKHLALRQARARPAMQALRAWLLEQEPRWPPRSKLGLAVRCALKQWPALTVFLDDPAVPCDNSASERALRVVALGRKNFLFVGHAEAGHNTAMLYSLVASCEANGINPEEYLSAVLLRVQTHPAGRIDELLPHRWMSVSA